jgi:hypothetical protein
VGTILYQYLSGRLPYEGKNELAVLKALNAGKPAPPLPPSVPAQVAQVVHRALSPALDQRFQTALDMQRALEAALPQPVNATDVAAFMAQYLEERIETRRKDLTDAIAELEEASGKPKQPRGRKSSLQELARPAILDQVLGRAVTMGDPPSPRAPSSPDGPPHRDREGAVARASADARGSPEPPLPDGRGSEGPDGEDAIPTRLREGPPELRPIHYAMMIAGAVVPMVVWGLVAWIALHGPIGRKAHPAPHPLTGPAAPGLAPPTGQIDR